MASRGVRAAKLLQYGRLDAFQLGEIPFPQPSAAQVVVKVEASPINPSDLGFILGKYAFKRELPAVPGNECSGTIVLDPQNTMKGQRVACLTEPTAQGAWAEYTLANRERCVQIPDNVSFAQGACFFVNPLTARMFEAVLLRDGHKAVVQTAAASALGKMFARVCQNRNVSLINVVRRQEQVDSLRTMGCQHVLNSSDKDFAEKLKELCTKLKATAAFDALSGDIAGVLLKSLSTYGVLYMYGSLSDQPANGMDPNDFIFSRKRTAGLFLTSWLQSLPPAEKSAVFRQTMDALMTTYRSDISREFPLEEVQQALQFYQQNMSLGKVIIRPNRTAA